MPLQNFRPNPGINKEVTDYTGQGQWVDSDFVRFFQGLPQKIKGWEKFIATTLVGVVRDQHAWISLDGTKYIALGTDRKLYIIEGGVAYDVTPLNQPANTGATSVFSTTNGSSNVTVNISGHNAEAGAFVTFDNVTLSNTDTSFDATTFEDKEFEIQGIANANAFYIDAGSNEANVGITAQGTTDAAFQINPGPEFSVPAYGFGTFTFGGAEIQANNTLNGAIDNTVTTITLNDASNFSTSGTAVIGSEIITYSGVSSNDLTGVTRGTSNSTASAHNDGDVIYKIDGGAAIGWGEPSTSSNVTLEARQWSLDNFGEDLIATVLNGKTFRWDKTNGVTTRAVSLANTVPSVSRLNVISPERFLILFGTESTAGTPSTQDALLLRFSSQENIEEFQPQATNSAGSLRLASGSKIIAVERSRGQILIWTDSSLHSLQFIGSPFQYGQRQLGQNCGIIGQHAGVDLNGVAYWMSQDSFYLFDGAVQKLPCTVEQFVFNNINIDASENGFASHNGEFNEILWFYARTGSDQINAVVAYNYLERTWWTGSLARTTWIDKEVTNAPVATEYDSTLIANNETIVGLTNGATTVYLQETGNDADGEAIEAYLQSGSIQIAQGDEFAYVSRYIPDVQNQSGTLNMNLSFQRYPNDSSPVSKTTSFTSTTDKVDLRGRGREFTANIVSNTTGTAWRLGTLRFEIQPDGRR